MENLKPQSREPHAYVTVRTVPLRLLSQLQTTDPHTPPASTLEHRAVFLFLEK